MLKRIAANHIPAFMVGGEYDIFQHGEPLDYAELQNAWAHRSVTAPMSDAQKVTGRYQLIDGPWEHINGSSVDVDRLELEWFDTWLKHEDTGMASTPTPLHYYDLGTGKFRETARYPFSRAKAERLYFGDGNHLTGQAPGKAGTDAVYWSPAGSPCGRPIDQWSMGGISIPAHSAGLMAPCADDDRTTSAGPYAVTYTTKPFRAARTLAGPIAAHVYATSTTTEAQWVAEVEIVTPSGASYPITEGALLGSLRALDESRSWRSGGIDVMPYHPYTRSSQRAVKTGKLTRYDIEIFPTLATVPKGDSLRVTLSTTDTPHLTPLPSELAKLAGGEYVITHSKAHPSNLAVEFRKP
jgi:putative CocE/NonD family hydrolase